MTMTTHGRRPGRPGPSTPQIASGRPGAAREGNLGRTTRAASPAPAGAVSATPASYTLLDEYPGEVSPPVLVHAATALSEGYAARTWGNEATRLRFNVTVPAGRAEALDLRDELIGWLRRRGLDLGLTDDGTDVYMTWPRPRVPPDLPPIDGPSVYPARTPGGRPDYVKPTITSLTSAGTCIADCADVRIQFALTDQDRDELGIYEGTIPQGDLFRTLFEAGLITRREGK